MKQALIDLVIGVKRRAFRVDDKNSSVADAEYRAKRPKALEVGRFACIHCGYQSREHMEIHHWDDNHANNSDDNLKCNCRTCHPHHHVGQASLDASASQVSEHLGKKTYMAVIPEMTTAEFALFQRAIGVALNDPETQSIAFEVLKRLSVRASAVKSTWGTFWPADFAAAMANLQHNEYEERGAAVKDLGLLFHVDTLKQIGKDTAKEQPSLPVTYWSKVANDVRAKVSSG